MSRADELLDWTDETGRVRGQASRARVHAESLWHPTFHLWVVSEIEGVDHLVLQRHSEVSPLHAGRLDTSCTGHLLAGESVAGGVREVAEELGPEVRIEDCSHIGDVTMTWRPLPTGVLHREIAHTFLWRTRGLGHLTLPDGDVTSVVALPLDSLPDLLDGATVEGVGHCPGRSVAVVEVSPTDLVVHPRWYWDLVLERARTLRPGYAAPESVATRAFHARRRMLVLLDEVVLAPEGSTLSHAEWFEGLGLDVSTMDTAVRGYVLDGELFLYTGWSFAEPDLERCRHLLSELASRTGLTGPVHLGRHQGLPGEQFTPRATTSLAALLADPS